MKLSAMNRVVLVMLGAMLIAGCSRERIDWKSAEAADTEQAYNRFLERHPDSALATQARTRIAQLAEDRDWKRASATDTAEAYQAFLAQHGTGKWAQEARIRIENFTLDESTDFAAGAAAPADSGTAKPGEAATPRVAEPANSASPPRSGGAAASRTESAAPAGKAADATARGDDSAQTAAERDASARTTPAAPPPGPPGKSTAPAPVAPASTQPAAAAAASSGYGIQLGAFSSQAAALDEWKRLQVKFDPQLHGLFARAVPVQVTSGTLFRLQSPVGDEARARSICTALTERAQPCVVVLPETR
jgi:hypothetical protein